MAQFDNGLKKIIPVKKTDIKWYPSRKEKVLAIDFGTSTLAVSYVTPTSKGPLSIKLDESSRDPYIPTILLIENNEIHVGELALISYTRVFHENPLFFDRVKLELHDDETVGRHSYVYGSDGKSYYLVEVIAIILYKVRQLLIDYFKIRGDEHHIDEFHWVLTVPALWGKRARNMMRSAASLAGLCSDSSPGIKNLLQLRPTYTHYPPSIKQQLDITNPEKLSLVYEPDGAAAWCRDLTPDKAQGPDAKPPLTTDDYFLTVDVGGGTIDVTGHQMLENGRMKRVQLPCGDLYGGTTVNERFKIFLQSDKVLDDPHFSKYLSGQSVNDNRAEFMGLVYVKFEWSKKVFTQDTSQEFYVVEIPNTFYIAYEMKFKDMRKAERDKNGFYYNKRTQQLSISRLTMSTFFEPSLHKIEECIDRSIAEISKPAKLKIIYLVGGFGGCKYVSEKIRSKYGRNDNLRVIVPHNPAQSIVLGACQYHKKKIFEKADATYGIETCMEYDETNKVHVNGKKRKTLSGEEFCENLFQPYIQIGDELKPDQVYMGEFLPIEESQSTIGFDLYRTDQVYADYTDELTLIAKISIACQKNQKVEFVLDFSGTEIQVFAYQEYNSKRVNASVDFLSTLNKFENLS